MTIKAYLDTCIISGLAKEDIAIEEMSALLAILQRHKEGSVGLVTSELVREEINRVPQQHRLRHQVIYNLIADVPTAKAFRMDLGLALTGVGGGRRLVKELAQLTTLLKDEPDAAHIYQTLKNEIPYFLTVDEATVLSKASQIEQICGVRTMLPSAFLREVLDGR